MKLKAPFPYPGGKSRVVDIVWPRLGQTSHYVEPFCGSAAMLLGCPWTHSLEVINDQDHFIANFWRAIKHQPDNVASHADYPCIHVDLTARHAWLKNPDRVAELREKLRDPKIAGWFVWCMAHFIGSGFTSSKNTSIPHTGNAGRGIAKLPDSIPHISNAGQGVGYNSFTFKTFKDLADRLRRVRVINGEWTRCLNNHYGSKVSYFLIHLTRNSKRYTQIIEVSLERLRNGAE